MLKYSSNFKETLVGKVSQNSDRSVSSIALEAGVSKSALHKWVKSYSNSDIIDKNNSAAKRPQDWNYQEKLEALFASHNLSEQALGSFCRKAGIHSHHLTAWKNEVMTNNPAILTKKQTNELKALRAENKQLKRDLTRKDKALSETSALLILKKKTDLIWGDLAED